MAKKSPYDLMKDMHKILPEGEQGIAKIVHQDIGNDQAQLYGLMSALKGQRGPMPGRYVNLYVQGTMMMSDTYEEQRTNFELVRRAEGDVLIAGLGIGMVLRAVLSKPEVKTVLVVEKHQDVIDLVLPHLEKALPKAHFKKLTVVCDSIFDWTPPKGVKWDVIYFDIWAAANIPLDESTKLKRRFARRKKGPAWMWSWNEDYSRRMRRQSRW
jgi:hypothetical protein